MISASQVSVSPSASVLLVAAACRTHVRLRAMSPSGGGGGQFFLGGDSSVTTSSGYTFFVIAATAGEVIEFDLCDGDELWAIRNVNTANIDVLVQV